ncbi:tRNA-dihydrouridine synthase 3 [Lithohypha guttulata]|nr:tRNA-dihydrouridine synthase 3 [Lithohypha guttulata]
MTTNEGANGSTDIAKGYPKLQHEPSSLVSDATIEIKTESPTAKRKLETNGNGHTEHQDKRRKGTAPVKAEFIIHNETFEAPEAHRENGDDDAAEAFHHKDRSTNEGDNRNQRKKQGGQNKNRSIKAAADEVGLCATRSHAPEFSPRECPFGQKCKFEHDLRRYLKDVKKDDLETFDGVCPVWKARDGRKELILVEVPELVAKLQDTSNVEDAEIETVNIIDTQSRQMLNRKKFRTPKSDKYIPWMDGNLSRDPAQQKMPKKQASNGRANSSSPEPDADSDQQDRRSAYVEQPLLPSEKRRLYYGPDTPVLAPLTTQGNLPFRRLCTTLGATFTFSEMAMSMPLLSGQRSEWALLKAHESEIQPPNFISNDAVSALKSSKRNIVYDYSHSTDTKFGAQISSNKPWLAIKTTEVLAALIPNGLRVIDMNCGCPIDLVYKEGAGSALMDSPNKLDKMLRGMNAVSGAIPVSCKIRMGTKTGYPTAQKLVERLVLGAKRNNHWSSDDERDAPCGVAAITLHGRSRQQRYTREADWEYISETASLIESLNNRANALSDTIHEPDARDLAQPLISAQSSATTPNGVHFLGNGDIFSHEDYYRHLENAPISACMVARGALIKPWIFEEIHLNQYLDKSATERLDYIRTFVRNGLSAWGTDTHGISTTRRFLLEYLSFTHRYVPVGLLEYLPPKINERPPRYRGRDELETLLASDSYKDWIRISEMFLGKVGDVEGKKGEDYGWVPKHKSHAWDGEAQG